MDYGLARWASRRFMDAHFLEKKPLRLSIICNYYLPSLKFLDAQFVNPGQKFGLIFVHLFYLLFVALW